LATSAISCVAFLLSAFVAFAGATNAPAGGAVNQMPLSVVDGGEATSLSDLVCEYFQTSDEANRARLASLIESSAKGDLLAVARAVRDVQLWPALPHASGVLDVSSPLTNEATFALELPDGYDPAQRYPVIVCFAGRPFAPSVAIDQAKQTFRGIEGDYVLLAPDDTVSPAFHMPPETSGRFVAAMRQARRIVHMDTDRVFAFGEGKGADSAWMAAIAHPDLFAGLIALDGYPKVPYPEQLYPLLIENLRSTPVFMSWRRPPESVVPGGMNRTGRISRTEAHCRVIAELADRLALPFTAHRVSVTDDGDGLSALILRDAAAILHHKRDSSPHPQHKWFRYPGQGSMGWVRHTGFRIPPWQAEQLSIVASPTVDYNEFVTGVIKSKLAHLSARIDGQTITIDTRRCDGVDVFLEEGAVDFDKPVTIICNGRRRCEKLLEPSIATLLAAAYDNWEFQRLWSVRVSLSIRADMKTKRADRPATK